MAAAPALAKYQQSSVKMKKKWRGSAEIEKRKSATLSLAAASGGIAAWQR